MKGDSYMTGRDLIVYILSNNLENEEVFKDGKFIGFIPAQEDIISLLFQKKYGMKTKTATLILWKA